MSERLLAQMLDLQRQNLDAQQEMRRDIREQRQANQEMRQENRDTLQLLMQQGKALLAAVGPLVQLASSMLVCLFLVAI